MGQLRESRWVELNLVGSMGDACLLKSLPFGGKKKKNKIKKNKIKKNKRNSNVHVGEVAYALR